MNSTSQTITNPSAKTIVKLQVEEPVSRLWASKAKRLGMSRNDYLLNLLLLNEGGRLLMKVSR